MSQSIQQRTGHVPLVPFLTEEAAVLFEEQQSLFQFLSSEIASGPRVGNPQMITFVVFDEPLW
jgi:hypothetical protein